MERSWMAVNFCHLDIFIGGYLRLVMNWVAPILQKVPNIENLTSSLSTNARVWYSMIA